MMAAARDREFSVEVEEMRTRAFLLDLRALFLDCADHHSPLESDGLEADED